MNDKTNILCSIVDIVYIYYKLLKYKAHLFGRVTSLQSSISTSLSDSKDVNILSGRPLDKLFHDIIKTSRFFSEDMLKHNNIQV